MFIWTHPATNAHGLSIFHERWISWNNFHGQEVIYIGDIWPYRSSFHSFHSPQNWMPDLEGPVKEPQFSSTIPQKMDARILMAMSPKDTSNLNLFGALAHLGADMDAVSGGFALTYVWPMFDLCLVETVETVEPVETVHFSPRLDGFRHFQTIFTWPAW